VSAGNLSRPLLNLDLRAWRNLRGRYPQPLPAQLEFRFYLVGAWLSAFGALQRRLYQRTLDELALRPPLFLLGHWRSGTTLLHELLALDHDFVTPSTYACFNPHHFLLSHPAANSTRAVTRPTGDIAVAADSPQEEEFALMCLGAISPYEAFLFPSALRDLAALSDPDQFTPEQASEWDRALVWILKATAYASGAKRRLVVKSPPNSFRVARLCELFPGALFVRIVREPLAVFASTLSLWETMWKRYALADPPPGDAVIDQLLAAGLSLDERMEEGLDKLPTQRVATIRYEELLADPYRASAALYEHLRLPQPAGLREQIERYFAAHPAPARPRISPVDFPWRTRVERAWAALFERYGYAAP
jgi:omega-hydroxy-beta-dihydromenaquinone-9 sulfotransferase